MRMKESLIYFGVYCCSRQSTRGGPGARGKLLGGGCVMHPTLFISTKCVHATCKELIYGSTRGGMEGVEGELVASALGWGFVVLLGFGLTKSMLVIQNLQRPVPRPNACLWVCGVDIEGDLIAQVVYFKVSSRYGEVWLIVVAF
eukprot:1154428-Pelagomonas_calceolata.AAC.2